MVAGDDLEPVARPALALPYAARTAGRLATSEGVAPMHWWIWMLFGGIVALAFVMLVVSWLSKHRD